MGRGVYLPPDMRSAFVFLMVLGRTGREPGDIGAQCIGSSRRDRGRIAAPDTEIPAIQDAVKLGASPAYPAFDGADGTTADGSRLFIAQSRRSDQQGPAGRRSHRRNPLTHPTPTGRCVRYSAPSRWPLPERRCRSRLRVPSSRPGADREEDHRPEIAGHPPFTKRGSGTPCPTGCGPAA